VALRHHARRADGGCDPPQATSNAAAAIVKKELAKAFI
jgi:hypothetical protein